MTACTNHGGKARRVVTAALVGVLSVGTVPMVALAEGAQAAADGIETLFAEGGIDGSEFAEGEVTATYTKVSDGTEFHPGTDIDGVTTVTAGNLPFTVSATYVQPAGSTDNIPVTPGHDYKVAVYRADEDGNPTGSPLSGNRVYEAGEYVLTVTPLTGSEYVGQTFTEKFQVIGEQIEANAPFEHGNPSDNYLQFTGSALDINFAMKGDDNTLGTNDDVELVEGKDYTVKYTKNGKTYDEVVDAGTYTATLTGLGKYTGTSATSAAFEVVPFNLVDPATDQYSHILIAPFEGELDPNPERVYWSNGDDIHDTDIDTSLVGIEAAEQISGAGAYDVKIKVDQDAIDAGNINYDNDNPITLTDAAVKVDAFATLMYNGAELQDSYDILPGQTFDVRTVTAQLQGVTLGRATADGTVNTRVPGEYKVTFTYAAAPYRGTTATPELNGKYIAASKTVTIRVWAGAIDADEALWVYGPDSTSVAINSYTKGFDGDQMTAGSFFVTNADRTVTSSNHLDVALYDSEGNEVDSAVDAGTYTLKVTSKDYLLSGTTEMPITIGKVSLDSARVGELEMWNGVAGEVILPLGYYNCGSNNSAIISLGLVYATGNDGASYTDWAPLSKEYDDYKGEDYLPDVVDVVVEFNDEGTWKPVANINKAGDYRVILTVGDDIADNFDVTTKTIEFSAEYAGLFKDVQPGYWAYNVIDAAYGEGYMNGTTAPKFVGIDTDEDGDVDRWNLVEKGVFNPEGTLTRGQVAAVLFNASGESLDETDSNYNEHTGWVTGFDDIDGAGKGNQFYAEGVAWCKQNGVVNGYDGNFRPDDPVTREEFVSMLANYAKAVLGDDTVGTVDAGVLADYPDGSKVTDWAEANVAWAAEKGIIGNGGTLMPTDTMTRAYCAAMMVNYLNPELAK